MISIPGIQPDGQPSPAWPKDYERHTFTLLKTQNCGACGQSIPWTMRVIDEATAIPQSVFDSLRARSTAQEQAERERNLP